MSPGWQRLVSRGVLLGPAPVRGAAARRARDPAERWMLRQGRAVRESFVRELLDRSPDGQPDATALQVWMLRQDDEVRESYIREVLEA